MKMNRSLVLVGCAALATALIVGAAVYFFSSPPEKQQTVERKTEERPNRKKRSKKERGKSSRASVDRPSTNMVGRASVAAEEDNLTAAQKALLDEVVYNILYTASDKPLKERINFKLLDQDIRTELLNNGINIPYHFRVETADGREVYRCPEYSSEGEESVYSQTLFSHDPSSKMGVVKIHFPDMSSYIFPMRIPRLSNFLKCADASIWPLWRATVRTEKY